MSCVKNIVKYGKKDIPELWILQVRDVFFADMEVFKGQGNDTERY